MRAVYLKLVLTALFWGGTFVAGRIIAQDAGPFSASFLRFAIASVLLAGLALKGGAGFGRLGLRRLAQLIALGLTGVFAYNVLFFMGLKRIEAGRAALIIASNPGFIALFSACFFREKLGLMKAAGILVSLSGALIVVSRGDPAAVFRGGVGWGELYIFGCVLSWVAYSLIGKVVLADLSPMAAVTWACALGALGLLPAACFEGLVQEATSYRLGTWFGVAYLGVFGTALGFVWYYEGIRRIGPLRAGQFINLVPVSAVLLAFLILGEPLTLSLVLGAALVISGVYLTNRDR